MSYLRVLFCLSISVVVLLFLAFPISANAQDGITTIPDLNGDGKSDLLWYNPATGQSVAWIMDGTASISSTALLTDPSWKIISAADFNNDGTADLLWYNASEGRTALWLMNGTSAISWTVLQSNPDWRVIKTADFNGDHKADLLWYNAATGQTAIWLMNGATPLSSSTILTAPDWKVIATADFDGDGKADLLWFNESIGQTAAWIMNGTNASSWSVLFTDFGWAVIGTADFNGDGKSDLLWYNESIGQIAVWIMNGTNVSSWSGFPINADLKVIAAADLNGDGKSDLILRSDSTGRTSAWLLNGTSISSAVTLQADGNWKVTAAADFNHDSKADLLWYNSKTGQTSVWLMNGPAASSGANLLTDRNFRLRCIKAPSLKSVMSCDDATPSAGSGTILPNQAPSVNAGSDQTITLPAMANLSGTSNDDGSPIALLISSWSQVSGPGSVVFGNSAAYSTTATFSAAGTYILRLTVSDTELSAYDEVLVTANAAGTPPAPTNKAPVVNAGPDQNITLPSVANLAGTATDDGLPSGSTLAKSWSKVSGPGTVTFGNASAVSTTAMFSAAGTYTLRLTANDTLLSASDDVVIAVSAAASTNQAPVVNAGIDKTITLPAGTSLAGSATDDGLPSGSTLSVSWTKVSGPGSVTFGNASSLTSTATFSLAGTYTLRLTATDSLLSSSDDVLILVSAAALTGQSYYVDNAASAACSNSPSYGTLSNPWCTINYGIGHILGGDTLYVKAGTYSESVYVNGPAGTAGSPTTIRTFPGQTVTIVGPGVNGGRVKIENTSFITFDGFTITNFNQGLFVDSSSHIVVQNTIVHHVGQEGIHVHFDSSFVTLEGNTIHDTRQWMYNGEGIYVGSSSTGPLDNSNNVTIRNNLIYNTNDEGIELKPGTHDCIVEGNTLYNIMLDPTYSTGAGAIELNEATIPCPTCTNGLQTWTQSPNHIVRNNVVHSTKTGIRAGTGSLIYNNIIYDIPSPYYGILADNNAGDSYTRRIYHNTVDVTSSRAIIVSSATSDVKNNIGPATANNIASSAGFYVNAAGANYHLVSGSAPINAGSNLTATVPTDAEGISRSNYGAPDLGAYESVTP